MTRPTGHRAGRSTTWWRRANAISPQHTRRDTGPMVQPPDPRPKAVSSGGAVVLAVTTDDDRYAAARAEATRIAAEQNGRLICTTSMPRRSSATRSQATGPAKDLRRTPSELDEADLEAAGRSKIAEQVAQAREAGVPTTAWLPSKPGPEPLTEYAREHGVSTIVVPRDLEAAGELERLATRHHRSRQRRPRAGSCARRACSFRRRGRRGVGANHPPPEAASICESRRLPAPCLRRGRAPGRSAGRGRARRRRAGRCARTRRSARSAGRGSPPPSPRRSRARRTGR